MYFFILGFHLLVWWPKCTPASRSCFIEVTAIIVSSVIPPRILFRCAYDRPDRFEFGGTKSRKNPSVNFIACLFYHIRLNFAIDFTRISDNIYIFFRRSVMFGGKFIAFPSFRDVFCFSRSTEFMLLQLTEFIFFSISEVYAFAISRVCFFFDQPSLCFFAVMQITTATVITAAPARSAPTATRTVLSAGLSPSGVRTHAFSINFPFSS